MTAVELFEALENGYGRAVAAAPEEVTEVPLRLAGGPAVARVAGRALARRALAPLGPLRTRDGSGGSPELEIGLWDEEATGVPLDTELPPAGVEFDESGRFAVSREETGLTGFDRATGRILGWRRSARALAPGERWRALPGILPLWYRDRGIIVVHAALAARDGEGVLLVGPSGAGKSATVLACAAHGLEFGGDDRIGIEVAPGAYTGHMVYANARLQPAMRVRHPELLCEGTAERLADGKELISPGPGASVVPSATVLGIAVLGIGANADRIAEATPGEALLACAPYSLVGTVGGAWGMARIAEMVRSLPLRRLEVAGGPREAAALVADLIGELRGAGPPAG